MSSINTIFFDLGKVLLDFNWAEIVEEIRGNKDVSMDEVLDFLLQDSLLFDFETGKVETDFFLERLRGFLDYSGSVEQFQMHWNDIFTPMDENIRLMSRLVEKYNVGLISNINDSHKNWVEEKYPFLQQIPHRIYSSDVGHRKPDPEIYKIAMSRLGATPAESLFIDDMEENIKSASSIGISTIHVKPDTRLAGKLQELGIDADF